MSQESPRPTPAAAPATGRGTIVGTVIDASTSYPVVGAMIEVVGQKLRAESDIDGKFRLPAPPGTYDLRISADLYRTKVVTGVVVTAGKSTEVGASLPPRVSGNVQLVEVTEVNKASEETQLAKRKEAATVSEVVGAETIAKSAASDAAEVVTRVPAVTIKDDKFLVVRGLSERYSNALLNGSRLPSTDPNRRILPLDLFPADFIESLNLIKAYTPDLPGDFSGGLVDIELAEPSRELTYSIGISLGVNTETTFQDYKTYDSTPADWFTLGDDFRDLPSIFGNGDIGGALTTAQQRAYVGSLPLNWNVYDATAPPNFGIDAAVSNSWGPFGINLAATYGWNFSTRRGSVENSFIDQARIPDMGEMFVYDQSDFEVQLGAVLTAQYVLSKDHKFAGRSLVNRKAVDAVQVGRGEDRDSQQGQLQLPTSSVYTTDQLGFGQLEGRHHFSLVDVDWRASWAPSNEDQPDAKFYIYEGNIESDQTPFLIDRQPSTQRTFSTLSEFLQDYYLDVTLPFTTRLPFTDVWRGLNAKAKGGLAYSLRDRDFLFRSYRTVTARVPEEIKTRPPDSILIPRLYASNGPFFEFQGTQFEPFEASQEIAGAYGMVDLPIVPERVRLIGGVRTEYSYLKTNSRFLLPMQNGPQPTGSASPDSAFIDTIVNDLDPIPGVSLIYSPLDDMNVRAAFSQTVARPEFRELTPTRLPSLPGERTLVGNPLLITSHITNYDLRWEWFFSPLELASVGFFYKDLEDPIEKITAVETSNVIDTFVNSASATIWGFEFEGRKSFDFLVPYAQRVSWLRDIAANLADLQFQVNASVVESSVSDDFGPALVIIVPIAGSRPLQGTAPYVINAQLEYEHERWGVFRALYNTSGPTIAAAGTDVDPNTPGGVAPDIIDERRDALDFVWLVPIEPFGVPLTGKFAVENVLNDRYLQTQGDGITQRYRTGATFSFGVSYSF
jgi:TonB-dependent receptor